jgi:hypothetical protein
MPEETLDTAFEGVDGGAHKIGDAVDTVADTTADTTADTEEKNWSDYGLPEDFNSMPREQMAQRVKEALYRERQWGEQGNTIGELRRKNQEMESKIKAFLGGSPEDGKKAEQIVEDMSDGQKADFFANLERNPRKAIMDAIGNVQRSEDDIHKMIDDRVNEILQGYHDWAGSENIVAAKPEYARHKEYVEFLAKPEHLGAQRAKRDIYELAELLESNKTLGNMTYDKLKSYPSMGFAEAKRLSDLELIAKEKAAKTKEDIEQEVAGVDGAVKKGAKKAASKTETITSLDDAFDID